MIKCIDFQSVDQLYTQKTDRYVKLVDSFKKRYGVAPHFIGRAPGRVNIIGEHIDYEGYGVFPAAIEKDCLIAAAATTDKLIHLGHINPEMYPNCILSVGPEPEESYINNYAKYVKAGYIAVTKQRNELSGMQLMVEGNVPQASGLSSSSALCVCSALIAMRINGIKAGSMEQIIEKCIQGERIVGTASGGMDQSISILGRLGKCLYIQFSPIRSQEVGLPANSVFIVMNSLVESAKLETAVYRYNKRVCECRFATRYIAAKLNLPHLNQFKILKYLQEQCGLPLTAMTSLVEQFLPKKQYGQEQLAAFFQEPLENILEDIPRSKEVLAANKEFALYQAAKHVFQEAQRVIQFIQICKSSLLDEPKSLLLGTLMNESQTSCHQLYNCSCPEIQQLTGLARKHGAYGSRLTGAGWGGCTVSLVEISHAEKFKKLMWSQYFMEKSRKERAIEFGEEKVIFVTRPAEGACYIQMPK